MNDWQHKGLPAAIQDFLQSTQRQHVRQKRNRIEYVISTVQENTCLQPDQLFVRNFYG